MKGARTRSLFSGAECGAREPGLPDPGGHPARRSVKRQTQAERPSAAKTPTEMIIRIIESSGPAATTPPSEKRRAAEFLFIWPVRERLSKLPR